MFQEPEHWIAAGIGLLSGGSVVGVVVRLYAVRLVNRALGTVTGELIAKALADGKVTDNEVEDIIASFRGQTTLFGEQGFGRQGP